ncbi:universal stress protein [Leptothermofonsia sp. ETS-13]|uniref:universal stress protein n=1 Tax=Leptothermofonsia sp. ETS-13 TaxID=3035696 RepID=UPI003B9FD52A
MNTLSMLARLEGALGRNDLAKRMVLIPQSPGVKARPTQDLNFVVGYNGSPKSQTALDLTLWIAHQTRLATQQQVIVQVVYVVDWEDECGQSRIRKASAVGMGNYREIGNSRQTSTHRLNGGTIAELHSPSELLRTQQSCQFEQFEQADRILWQARHLAEEWRGSLETHLRFGRVAEELRSVVETESAALLLLGCESAESPLIARLGNDFPCPVLGIPPAL